jgi:osmotically-inducible protein OsmY
MSAGKPAIGIELYMSRECHLISEHMLRPRPSGRAGHRAWRACGMLALGVLFSVIPATARSSPVRGIRCAAESDTDRRLTALARRALDDDLELSILDLGVSVRENVATVWGAVPSPALASRAAEAVRGVPGVARVINQVSIESPNDPLVEFLKLPARTLPMPAAPGAREGPTVAARNERTTRAAPGLTPTWHPATPKLTSRAPSPADDIATMPAIALPMRPDFSSRQPPPATAPAGLAGAVAQLQRSNERLRAVQPEVRGGVVYLRGVIYSWDDLFALARAASRLPGVERVVIENVQTVRP